MLKRFAWACFQCPPVNCSYNRATLGAQHHYVSMFHLRQFLDPASLTQRDPWLWLGSISDGLVKRRAPKNVGTKRSLFDGPGGLADRNASLESFLAREVESPAAVALREFCSRPRETKTEQLAALMRYLAWAAARSLPMRELFSNWAKHQPPVHDQQRAEPPPEGLLASIEPNRDMRMVHPKLGARVFSTDVDRSTLADDGWVPDLDDPANFLEAVHIQAYYFQVRFFPRFRWFTLRPPENESFVLADRAVGWAAEGYVNAPPNYLRNPSAYVLAPLSPDLVLVGRHNEDTWSVTSTQINTVIAAWAHDWIVGSNGQVVESALRARREALTQSS